MVEELLDWQDYVGWIVLIAPTVAFSLVFWRVKAVRYAIVGTMAGLIVVSLTMPLGADAEAFGLNDRDRPRGRRALRRGRSGRCSIPPRAVRLETRR